jgi:RNA recognition motif-containing protein
MNIFIARITPQTTEKDLMILFGKYGEVSSVRVVLDKETGESKRFGFVEMVDEAEGINAINALNETEFQGRVIVVKKAHSLGGERRDRSHRYEGGRVEQAE